MIQQVNEPPHPVAENARSQGIDSVQPGSPLLKGREISCTAVIAKYRPINIAMNIVLNQLGSAIYSVIYFLSGSHMTEVLLITLSPY